MTHLRDDWNRLAVYVASARQDAGFPTVRSFAAAIGITERTLGGLERGGRVSRDTLLAVAKAVGWTPDSPLKILAGGEPVMIAGEPATAPPPPPAPEDDALRQIMEDDRLPLEVRRGMVALAEAMRRRSDEDRDGRSALPAVPLRRHQAQPRRPRLRAVLAAGRPRGRGTRAPPVGGHRGQGLAVGAHLRLKLGDPVLGVTFPFPCPPGPQRQGAPGCRQGGRPREVHRPVDAEPRLQHRRRRPPGRHHCPQGSPGHSLHRSPPPPRRTPPGEGGVLTPALEGIRPPAWRGTEPGSGCTQVKQNFHA